METDKKSRRPFPKRSVGTQRITSKTWASGIGWKKVAWVYALCFPVAAVIFWLVWVRQEREVVRNIPILMYHRVATNDFESPWCVQTNAFMAQLRSLRILGYETIMPSDLAANRKWGKPLPVCPVIITFDDGDLETLKTVEPMLEVCHYKAVAYLITGLVGDDPAASGLHEGHKSISWPEAKAMQRRGTIAFGGHSHEHKNLAGEANPSILINECRKQLVSHGASESDSFCYPHGQRRPETVQAVRKAGFTTGVVCEDKIAVIDGKTDLLTLPRVSVMGGKHEFSVFRNQTNEPPDEIVFTVRHEGIPIELTPALKDVRGAHKWMESREFGQGDSVVSRKIADLKNNKAFYTLDIWDKHRLFCMFYGKIRIVLPALKPVEP